MSPSDMSLPVNYSFSPKYLLANYQTKDQIGLFRNKYPSVYAQRTCPREIVLHKAPARVPTKDLMGLCKWVNQDIFIAEEKKTDCLGMWVGLPAGQGHLVFPASRTIPWRPERLKKKEKKKHVLSTTNRSLNKTSRSIYWWQPNKLSTIEIFFWPGS